MDALNESTAPAAQALAQLDQQVGDYVDVRIRMGVGTYPEIIGGAVEYLDGEDPAVVYAMARRHADRGFPEHLDGQSGWPELTDNDRLTLAWRDLDAVSIVAREDFACCQNCGLSEIGGELGEADRDNVRGYAFYHRQDTESAATGGNLHIAYGLFGQPPSAEIGAEVRQALRGRGLDVRCNGDVGERVEVAMDWRARRSNQLAAYPGADNRGADNRGVDDRGRGRRDIEVDVEVVGRWLGTRRPDDGLMSALDLTQLYLPWLPTGTKVRLETGAGEVVKVHRERAELVGVYADAARARGRVPRHEGMRLLRTDASDDMSTVEVPEADVLEVTYDHPSGSAPDSIPFDLVGAVDVLRRLPGSTGSFAVFEGPSGGVVQVMWEQQRLWLESPDPQTRTTIGRHVSIAEAERMLTILAREHRVAVAELGDVRTTSWPT